MGTPRALIKSIGEDLFSAAKRDEEAASAPKNLKGHHSARMWVKMVSGACERLEKPFLSVGSVQTKLML